MSNNNSPVLFLMKTMEIMKLLKDTSKVQESRVLLMENGKMKIKLTNQMDILIVLEEQKEVQIRSNLMESIHFQEKKHSERMIPTHLNSPNTQPLPIRMALMKAFHSSRKPQDEFNLSSVKFLKL
jgi:hypothetical protein